MVYAGVQKYNTTSLKLQTNQLLQYYSFDSAIFLESQNTIQKSFTIIQTGLVIQSDTTYEHIIDSTRVDKFHSIAASVDSMGFAGYAYVGFWMDQYY